MNHSAFAHKRGVTLIELSVGMAISALVLTGVYRLWKNHNEQALRIQRTIEARNQLALATKKINNAITSAGLGLSGVPALAKSDAIGTDTLFVYTNQNEETAKLQFNASHHSNSISVSNDDIFDGVSYVGLSDRTNGELIQISSKSGSYLILSRELQFDFAISNTTVYPASRRKYYTDQETETLILHENGSSTIIGHQLHNFQISFRDKNGQSTEIINQIRNVLFSLTGEFTPTMGTINSIVFSTTAIPRNLL